MRAGLDKYGHNPELRRREAVGNAMADLRLEGLAPTTDVRLVLEQFIQGEISEEELVRTVIAR